ncbi:MAG: hypothetical protein ACI9XK_001857 [Granulosicoccus sp.]|jgi:hypothetical protein
MVSVGGLALIITPPVNSPECDTHLRLAGNGSDAQTMSLLNFLAHDSVSTRNVNSPPILRVTLQRLATTRNKF